MPNENAIIYGKETQSDASRQKRAIRLGLIFSGVSAIGGLIMKGVNTWSNYKKSKAMTKAVEKLYEAQEIDHRRLTRLEGQTSLLAKTTKTAFQHIDYRLLHLDTKLNYTVQHMTEFFKRTERFPIYLGSFSFKQISDPSAVQWLCHVRHGITTIFALLPEL